MDSDQGASTEDLGNKALPSFRRDLRLYRGPDEADGSPTYSLYDPVTARYYQINWEESLIFKYLRPGMTTHQLIEVIQRDTPVHVTVPQILTFFRDCRFQHLLEGASGSEQILHEADSKRMDPLKWLLMHYLYVRVPLINPDVFLEKTIAFVRPLWSRVARAFYFLVTMVGLFQLLGRFDEFIYTFPYFFNFQGLLMYGLAITGVKLIHEFSHAYTAKNYGVHVPTMGMAFLVLWPVLYTDVTDSWKLAKRKERLAISFAGVAAELVLAGMATCAWAMSSAGIWQSIFFVVASVTWISSLFINLNPALRFDGYYLLSDLWGVDNLQSRAFAMARWQLRRLFLGIEMPPPEPIVSNRRLWGMVLYSVYTWIYRLFLYTAIALFVYFKFTKVLGIFLLLVELAVFIGWPLLWELQQVSRLRPYFKRGRRLFVSMVAVMIFMVWLFVPYPHTERFPAVTVAVEDQVVYVPRDGVIVTLHVQRGDRVEEGAPLAVIRSEVLDSEIAQTRKDIEIGRKEVLILSEDDDNRAFIPEKRAELAAYEARLQGLLVIQKQMTLTATVSGQVYVWDEMLRVGQAVSVDQVFGKIAEPSNLEVLCFIPEVNLVDVYEGQQMRYLITGTSEEVPGELIQASPSRANELFYPQLGSIYEGDLPVVTGEEEELLIVESYYPYRARLTKDGMRLLRIGQRGECELRGPARSRAARYLRFAGSILLRESGF